MKPLSLTSPAGLLGEPPGLGVEGEHFHHFLREKDPPSCPDTWCPSWGSLEVGCLPVYTLFEFASSQRRLPVSTNRPQERSKARAGEFREEEWRMAILPPCNGRVEIYVDGWSRGRTRGTEAKFPGPWALIWLCPPCPDPLLQEAQGISPFLNPDLPVRLRLPPPLSPSRAVPVPLPAKGSLTSAGPAAAGGEEGMGEPALPSWRWLPPLLRGRRGGRPVAVRGSGAAAAVTHALTREECRRQGCPVVTSPPHRRR